MFLLVFLSFLFPTSATSPTYFSPNNKLTLLFKNKTIHPTENFAQQTLLHPFTLSSGSGSTLTITLPHAAPYKLSRIALPVVQFSETVTARGALQVIAHRLTVAHLSVTITDIMSPKL
jgi:hypothetical protein